MSFNPQSNECESKRPVNIVILGGGSAGWMTANLMATHWHNQQVNITLVEAPNIPTIGVGEGSTPQLKSFFDKIGVDESQWMPACNATYKNGILFKGWSTRPGFEQYFHPFTSLIDAHTAPAFVYNTQYRRKGENVDCHPDRFFLSAHLAKHQKAPIGADNFPFDIGYGYHFDANLLGAFLTKVAVSKGVTHVKAKVEDVSLYGNEHAKKGDISHLTLTDGKQLSADLFIDCSGFRARIIQQALKVNFVSYSENLMNDSAVTIATPYTSKNEAIDSQTVSTAMKYGWAWDIPLTNRRGNGYVYSSAYCSKEQAEQELRDKLGLNDTSIEANHIKMKVGRLEKHWHKNCVAIGLSQGFIEPLEATALHFVIESIEGFINAFDAGNFTDEHQSSFNQSINNRFEGIRDYIVAHYRLSSRDDTQYWRDNSVNPNISNHLKKIVQCWVNGDDLNQALIKPNMVSFYPPVSWHAILAGYGVFPPIDSSEELSKAASKYDLNHIDDFINRCAKNYNDHAVQLNKK